MSYFKIHRLSILALLTTPLNSSISNREYSYKKKEIEKDTRLQIDKILKDYESYNQELIDKRAELLHMNIVNLFEVNDNNLKLTLSK